MVTNRALTWIGLALALAAPLIDLDALGIALAGSALPPTLAARLAGRLAQALVFTAAIAVLRLRRPGAGPFPLLPLCGAAAALLGMEAAAAAFLANAGVVALLLAGAAVALALLALGRAATLLGDTLGWRRRVPSAAGPLLAVATITLCAAGIEALLSALARRALPSPSASPRRLAMPDELGRREVTVEGARAAWWWQGQLHVFDAEGCRRVAPPPPKDAGTFRVAAIGDSLTYGYGVAADEAWPARLHEALRADFAVEVLNFGVCGSQSADILEMVRRMLPRAQPDLVLYGVCLNDFLPAGRAEYRNNRAWRVDFPGANRLEAATRFGALVAEGYDRLLMRVGVRADFMTDILRDFDSYQRRFARDVAALNRAVTDAGLPPAVALVLNQSPAAEWPGWEIVAIAERSLKEAGMTVVPAGYLRDFVDRDMRVSHWEGHPSAEAHEVFAGEFLDAVQRDPRLAAFRREAQAAAPPVPR